MRVVIDARIPDGAYGGVQQWVIGLAHGLSQLTDEPDEYLFLVRPEGADWLLPYLGANCRLLFPVARPASQPGRPARRGPLKRTRRAMRAGWSRVRSLVPLRHREQGPLAPIATPRVSIPGSDGTVEGCNADVVHFPFQAAFLTSVPSIYQPWDLQHLHLPEFFTPEQRERRELTYRAFCAQARIVVVASEWIKQDVVLQYGVDAARIEIVGVPPPTRAYRTPGAAERLETRARLQLPERFIYYPAQTWPHKNHARLFEALRILRDSGLVVPLVSTGQLNSSFPQLQALAGQLGIDADVAFLGFVGPLDVAVLYEEATMLIFPSLYEGWGLPVVEAFAAGLPVACSNVTSLPELVGDAALVFDPYDPAEIAAAIRRIWMDPGLATELARRGQEVAGHFDWRATAARLRSLYHQAASPLAALGPNTPGPRISVIIAVLNGARTLQATLDSILAQTYDQVEVVVMDGGSTDGTTELLERNGDRITFWASEPDTGVYNAWNKALDHVTGDWVLFLGADDHLHDPEVLAGVAAALAADRGAHRVAFGDMDKHNADGSLYPRRGRPWTKGRRKWFRRGHMIPHPATFHHRSLFDEGRFDEGFAIAGDYEFLLRELTGHDPLFVPVLVSDMGAAGLSDRPSRKYQVAREVYRARHMHGIAKTPLWRSRHLGKELAQIWVARHVRPRLARIRTIGRRQP